MSVKGNKGKEKTMKTNTNLRAGGNKRFCQQCDCTECLEDFLNWSA